MRAVYSDKHCPLQAKLATATKDGELVYLPLWESTIGIAMHKKCLFSVE